MLVVSEQSKVMGAALFRGCGKLDGGACVVGHSFQSHVLHGGRPAVCLMPSLLQPAHRGRSGEVLA